MENIIYPEEEGDTNVGALEAERILKSAYFLNFYTNFKSLDQYNLFVSQIKEHGITFLKMNNERFSEKYYKLSLDIQILMVLMRLRLGLLEADLGFRFGINQSTVSRYFNFWINVMHSYVKQLPIWPSRQLINENMPDCFKRLYPSTRIILDGTEIFIEKPSDYLVQSSTYLTYKSHNTARGIIGITPNGFVSFISELYPGRMSEKKIVLKSELLKKLEPGDSIMADRGFTIEEDVQKYNLDLNIPPFKNRSLSQFDVHDEQTTRDIASVRIHVERAIRDIKIFRILHNTIPNSMANQLNEIWTVCSSNFTNVPLLNRITE